jgi:cellulose synthase/poly-beta-1,6-N-acetylglucosamine synthase-like glycosyltransferase
MAEIVSLVILLVTAAALLLLIPFALHRTYLVWVSRDEPPETDRWTGPLPWVTVQLPLYNEAAVASRLIDTVAALDYPTDRLEIQVLDDSDDGSEAIVANRVAHWASRGLPIRHLRRPARTGFKAGALAHGLAEAKGDFLLVLDADFVPQPDLIHRLLGPFVDATVGMVQARWDHLNEHESLLTRCSARLLDAHFFLEQGGRWAGGHFMSFNGTAGIWRKAALVDAGGWSADTLTEDLDASYRAQMEGWRFVFRPRIAVPAELPEGTTDLVLQQRRWAQGAIQTARKILPRLLKGSWSGGVKREAVIHLLGHLAHPLTVVFGLLIVPSAVARRVLGLEVWLPLDLAVFACATASFLYFFAEAGRRRGRPFFASLPTAFATMALGVGLSAPLSWAVARGAVHRSDPFERTPKRGGGPIRYVAPHRPLDTFTALTLLGWMVGSGAVALWLGLWATLPFVALFATGYAWLGLGGLGLGVGSDPVDATDATEIGGSESAPEANAIVGTS